FVFIINKHTQYVMYIIVGSYRLSEIEFSAGTKQFYVKNFEEKFTYNNVISIIVNRGGAGNSSFCLAQPSMWLCTIKQIDSTTYLISYDGSFPTLESTDGIQIVVNVDRPQDIYISDQISPVVSIYAIYVEGTATLAQDTVVNSRIVEFETGHGITTDDYLNFYGENRFNQSRVIGVTGNTIALNAPMDVSFMTGDTVERGYKNMAVNGSVTPLIFEAKPLMTADWDVCEIVFYIEDNAAMDNGKFGGISALPRGVLVRKNNHVFDNIIEINSNGDLCVAGDLKYDDRASGSGVYSVCGKISFCDRSKYGVAVRILKNVDKFEITIQDDLSALTKFYVAIHGHVVEY
ncbi:MAG: hypothetical protein ACOC33_03865, partial [bacterium]